MKKAICLLASISIFYISFSQNSDSFVEVIVEDTVKVEPDEIIFTVNFLKEHWDETTDSIALPYPEVQTQKPKKKKEKIDHVKGFLQLLQQLKIDTLPSDKFYIQSDYSYTPLARNAIHLKFYSKSNLKQFLEQAGNIENITGYITSLKSKNEIEAEKKLFEKLMIKSKTDAENIAAKSGKTILSLIQVKQIEEAYQGGWTTYPPLSGLGDMGDLIHNTSPDALGGMLIIKRKLVVRYAWK